MSIIEDYIQLTNILEKTLEFPKIKQVFFPSMKVDFGNQKSNNFGAVRLQDDSIGIIFIGLTHNTKEKALNFKTETLKGTSPSHLAKEIESKDLFRKTLAFGAINAISQSFLKKINYAFDFTTDSLGLLNLNKEDKVGMVGFFPPLVKRIENMNIPLVIIEKKERLVQKNEKWEVSLDPSLLKKCNKVLCTSTTVLNDSIDDILFYCQNTEKISMIGPTAGFLPDPLFDRGVDVIGGTYVSNPSLFIERIQKNKRWRDSTIKYCIQTKNYAGFRTLLKEL